MKKKLDKIKEIKQVIKIKARLNAFRKLTCFKINTAQSH